jgi:hypothetical protein
MFLAEVLIPIHPDAIEIHWAWPTLVVAVICLGLFVLAVNCFPVYVGETGIRSYDFWGMYSTMTWAEMATISRFRLLWLHYLIVRSKTKVIYIPLFLSAAPDNVLRLVLEK